MACAYLMKPNRGILADSDDRMWQALADERRRLVLAVLAEATPPIALGDLAGLVARREADRRGGLVDDRVEAIHVSLYHRDVPKLAAADLVDWNRDGDLVRPGTNFQDVLRQIETIAEEAQDDRGNRESTSDSSDVNGHPIQ